MTKKKTKKKTKKQNSNFEWFDLWLRESVPRDPIIIWGKPFELNEISILEECGPFCRVEIGSYGFLMLTDRLKSETAISHIDPLRRVLELYIQSPHDWNQIAVALAFEKKNYGPEFLEQLDRLPLSPENLEYIKGFNESGCN